MQQGFDQASDRVRWALQRLGDALTALHERTFILVTLQSSSSEEDSKVSELRGELPGFQDASEEVHRAYSALFAVPQFAAPEYRGKVDELRTELATSQQRANGMRDTLRGYLDDVERLYESPLPRRRIADVLPDVIEQWDLHSRRASAILNVFDEQVTPLDRP